MNTDIKLTVVSPHDLHLWLAHHRSAPAAVMTMGTTSANADDTAAPLTCEQLIADSTPMSAGQWADRWQQEAAARTAMFRELMAIKSECDDLEHKLTIARDALRFYENAVIVGGRYAALEALEATKL